MTSQVIVSELPVVDRSDADRRVAEIAHLAEQWFEGPVTLASSGIALRELDGSLRYVLTARLVATEVHPPARRMERVAQWLGLNR